MCTKWIKDVKKDPKTKAEQQKFQNTTLVNRTIEEVNVKLGLNNQLNFGVCLKTTKNQFLVFVCFTEDLYLMYQMCAFETAWNGNTKSPWCLLFSIDAMKVMQFLLFFF